MVPSRAGQSLAGRYAGGVQLGQRAALYCRVSTADQSCARQKRDLAAFAARAGYEVVGVYKETASGVRLDRAERRKVMALAQRREIDAVLVAELSRWGRSTTDLLATLRELEARHVSFVALNGMAFDLSTPHGRMMATVLAGIAEFERKLTQERIRSGIAAAKARATRAASGVGPPRAEGRRPRRRRAKLPPDRPRTGAQQEHRGRHREAKPGSRKGPGARRGLGSEPIKQPPHAAGSP
jgi:DNA invertase Pin-like site-specific DNA recombinase